MNCTNCKNCLICSDPDPQNKDSLAALCTLSESKGKTCREISYITQLGYDSLFADSPLEEEPWIKILSSEEEIRNNSNIPNWCPLNGKPDIGECEIDKSETSISAMNKLRNN